VQIVGIKGWYLLDSCMEDVMTVGYVCDKSCVPCVELAHRSLSSLPWVPQWVRGISVGISTRYGLEKSGNQTPMKATYSTLVQTVPGDHTVSAGVWRWPATRI